MIGGRVRPEQRPELLAGGRRQGVSGEKYFWPSSKHTTSGTLMPSEWRQDVLYGPYIRQNDWKK